MTTVFATPTEMASDSLIVHNSISVMSQKKVIKDGRFIFGMSGNLLLAQKAIACFINGEELPRQEGYNLLVADGEYVTLYLDGLLTTKTDKFDYSGSGGEIALGAYHVTRCVRTAVEVAMQYDVNSGGELCYETLKGEQPCKN